MRGPSAEIFELVKSLTGPERRFFQLYAHRHVIGTANNYWVMFTFIMEQEKYDEVALRARWEVYGNTAHFAVVKQQLYQQLLQSLHHFHAATDAGQQVKMALHQVGILVKKGLYAQAEKLLRKQGKAIGEEELFELWPEYYRLVRELWGKQYYKGIDAAGLTVLNDEEQAAIACLQLAATTRHTAETLAMLHYSKVAGRTVADVAEIDKLLAQLPGKENLPLRIQLDVLQATATGYFMKGDPKKAYEYNGCFIALLEKEGLVNKYAERYFSILNNYLVDSQVLGLHEQVWAGLKKLRGLEHETSFKKIPRLHINIFRLGYQLELNLCLAAGQFHEAPHLAVEIDKGLGQYSGQIVPHNIIAFQYLLAYLFFGNGQWNEALARLAIIVNETDEDAVKEIQGFARLLNLIAHYEAGHYRLLESLIESVYRYQKQRKQLFETERQVLAFLRRVNFVEERHIRDALLQAFFGRMEDLRKLPTEKRAFNYFDFGVWAQAHLKRRPFAEIFRRRSMA